MITFLGCSLGYCHDLKWFSRCSKAHLQTNRDHDQPWTSVTKFASPLSTKAKFTRPAVAFSPDGKSIAAGWGTWCNDIVSLRVWCSKTGHRVAGVHFTTPETYSLRVFFCCLFHVISLTRSKAKLAAGCSDGAIYMWETSSRTSKSF